MSTFCTVEWLTAVSMCSTLTPFVSRNCSYDLNSLYNNPHIDLYSTLYVGSQGILYVCYVGCHF